MQRRSESRTGQTDKRALRGPLRARPLSRNRSEDLPNPPTPRDYLRGPDWLTYCKDCLHRAYADMEALVDAGYGDTPLIQLRFKCSACRSRNVAGVVTGTRYGMDAASKTLRPPLRRER
jgi:hypothetical protein